MVSLISSSLPPSAAYSNLVWIKWLFSIFLTFNYVPTSVKGPLLYTIIRFTNVCLQDPWHPLWWDSALLTPCYHASLHRNDWTDKGHQGTALNNPLFDPNTNSSFNQNCVTYPFLLTFPSAFPQSEMFALMCSGVHVLMNPVCKERP